MNKAVGILQNNSVDYIAKAFTALNQGQTVLNLRNINDQPEIPQFTIEDRLQTIVQTGWYEGVRYTPNTSEDIAQVLFSSGTEGTPKAICISHSSLANTTQRLIDVMQIDDSIKEYIGVPAYYSFGFGRCRVASAAGGRFFLPKNGFNPLEIRDLLESDSINAISAVPSLWRVLLETPEFFKTTGHKVKWIEIGSQYMAAHEKSQLKEIFPKARIVQHYGLTEASRSTFLVISDTDQDTVLESVGQGLYGVEIKLNPDDRILIKGPHVASWIYKDGEQIPVKDENGWFATNDKGRIQDGFLYFEGRMDDIINCGGIKLSPEKLDREIASLLGSKKGFHTVKIPDKELGEGVALAVEKSCSLDRKSLHEKLNETLKKFGIRAGSTLQIIEIDAFPFTETGKLKRSELSSLCSQLLNSDTRDIADTAIDHSDLKSEIISIWENALRISPISEAESFFDLGGDSLSAIRVMLRMEAAGIPKDVCRQIFEGKSIAQLVEFVESQSESTTSSNSNSSKTAGNISRTPLATGGLAVNIARGLLVIINIMAHWNLGVVERLSPIFADVNRYLAPFYSSGTPGFAIVFGVGVGFFLYPRYRKNSASLTSLIFRNAIILGSGILLMAVLGLTLYAIKGGHITALNISNSLYSVIYFYFFAVISIPLWMRFLSWRLSFSIACLVGATALYSLHLYIMHTGIEPSSNALIQPWVLLFTAKYNYPEMFAGVLLGAAVGNWYRTKIENGGQVNDFIVSGVLLIVLSVLISIETQQARYWFIWPKGMFLWSWPCYLGMVMIILALTHRYLIRFDVNTHRGTGFALKITSIVGIMAFPFFIGHELVLPLVDLLRYYGIPGAIPLSLIVFFAVASVFMKRLYRLYFGRTSLTYE